MFSYVALTFLSVQYCYAANILILGYPSYSHLTGHVNVGKLLQDQGHNVAIAIPPQLEAKFQDKGLNFIIYNALDNSPELTLGSEEIVKDFFANKWPVVLETLANAILIIEGRGVGRPQRATTKIVKDKQLLKEIENFKPDLMLMDSSPVAIMLSLVPYKLGVPFVSMGYMKALHGTRTPMMPTVFPSPILPYTDQMTFEQRLINTFFEFVPCVYTPFSDPTLLYEYAPEKPYISLRDLQAKALLWIIIHPGVLDYNTPIMPNVKRINYVHSLTPKPLPQEFQTFIDSASEGIIIVSFGSLLKALPLHVMEKLLAAFEQTKYKFIIRSQFQGFQNSTNQFMFSEWIPQYDLLHNEKTKLFITHCGSNGQQESLLAGVPMIGFPIFGDQPHNAVKLIRKGFGLKLDLRTFTVQELVSAIEEVIMNPSYKAKVEKASAILKSDRVPPIEEAAFWINHVLKFGGDHLRSYAQDIPLWKYLGLDIIAFCLVLWHMFLYLVIKLVQYCFSRCFGRKQKPKNE